METRLSSLFWRVHISTLAPFPPLTRQAYGIFVEVLGRDHEEVGSALNLLAVVLGEQGRYLEVSSRLRYVT